MKNLVLGSFMVASMFSAAALADQWTGVVGDSSCGAKHMAGSEKDTACAKKCIKGGADPVFLSDGKVLKFDSDSKTKAIEHAGENVTIDGTLNGDTVTINTISAAAAK